MSERDHRAGQEGPNDYVSLGTLESVNGADANPLVVTFIERQFLQLTIDQGNLAAIGRDDTDLNL